MKITKTRLRKIIREVAGNWRDPINLPSGDELEGNEAIRGWHDARAAQSAFSTLKKYLVRNPDLTLEDAVENWLEDNLYDITTSEDIIGGQRAFLMRVGRQNGLDKI